jgi:hypothetical protein
VAFDADELAGLELVLEAIDVGEHLGDDLRRGVLEREKEELGSAAPGAHLFVGAEEVAPARVGFGERAEPGQPTLSQAQTSSCR